MPSDNLNNATVSQYGPVVENAGDSHVTQTLDVQSPPSGADLETPAHGLYYIVVTADPEYKVRASSLKIGNVNYTDSQIIDADSESGDAVGYIIYNPIGTAFGEFGSGVFIYRKDLGANLPDGILEVRMYDSLGSQYYQCDNQVILQVLLSEDFVMPASNVEMKININGNANICYSGTAEPCEDCEYEYVCQEEGNCGMAWYLRNFLLITTPWGTNQSTSNNLTYPGVFYTMAKYSEDDYNSKNNPFNFFYQGSEDNYISSNWLNGDPYMGLDDGEHFTPNVWNQSDISIQSCLGNSKPTCYTGYDVNGFGTGFYYPDSGPYGDLTLNTLGTVMGKLIFPIKWANNNNYGTFRPNSCSDHPDSYNSTISFGNVWQVDFGLEELSDLLTMGGYSDNFGLPEAMLNNYLSNFDTNLNLSYLPNMEHSYLVTRGVWNTELHNYNNSATIYPGGNILPEKECWYINISGCTANYFELIAAPEFVDVWSAITIQEKWSGQSLVPEEQYTASQSWLTSSSSLIIDDINVDDWTYYEYTEVDNQCDFDISNTELEQIDSHTVKICVPYRSDLVYARSWNHLNEGEWYSLDTDTRVNKIFVNVYPIEI